MGTSTRGMTAGCAFATRTAPRRAAPQIIPLERLPYRYVGRGDQRAAERCRALDIEREYVVFVRDVADLRNEIVEIHEGRGGSTGLRADPAAVLEDPDAERDPTGGFQPDRPRPMLAGSVGSYPAFLDVAPLGMRYGVARAHIHAPGRFKPTLGCA